MVSPSLQSIQASQIGGEIIGEKTPTADCPLSVGVLQEMSESRERESLDLAEDIQQPPTQQERYR